MDILSRFKEDQLPFAKLLGIENVSAETESVQLASIE